MTLIGALGGILLGAIPGMTATMGVALLVPFSVGMDLIPAVGLLLGICEGAGGRHARCARRASGPSDGAAREKQERRDNG